MVKSKTSALGIIFPNNYDHLVPELVSVRLMASIPFASRYRLIDFVLSGMANNDIDNISIMVSNNYHSLMDHLGSGRAWDLVRKNGGLHIFPPYAERNGIAYTGRVTTLASILDNLRDQKEQYVVISDCNTIANFDYKAMIAAHIEKGADVTIAYTQQEIPHGLMNLDAAQGFYYTYAIDEDRINKIYVNSKSTGIQNLSMGIIVLERELLIDLINTAFVRGQKYFERDILLTQLGKLKVYGYKYDGYVARITSLKDYFDESMKLLDDHNLDALFDPAPVYTKIRDDNPSRYMLGASVKNTMAADGCLIEGEVENCILFRGVKIAKGAKVKNSILMQDTVVEAGASVEYIITDKEVTISAGKEMKGTDSFPVYIAKRQTV